MEGIGPPEVIKEVIKLTIRQNFCPPFARNQYRERQRADNPPFERSGTKRADEE
jgi:hypothetical protein